MKAIFPFSVYYILDEECNPYYSELYVGDMKLSMHNEEIFDEKLKNSVHEFIQENYFDYSVFDTEE